MKAPVRPVLLRKLRLRCGDWTVRELRVNRHLQPFDTESPHRHAHGQLLLYLRGKGSQRIDGARYPVSPGAVFFVPPGTEHSFSEHSPRLAICLVADLSGSGPVRFGRASGWLPAEDLATVREQLNRLAHERGEGMATSGELELGAGGTALHLLEACRRACLGSGSEARPGPATVKKLLRAVAPGEPFPAPAELARRIGLQKDHLNRLVRRSTGLTLGQWRARRVLAASEKELAREGTIAEAAVRLGFPDANYFSRWFRRQTGMTPSSWRERLPGRS